jgi:hypothetical protein
MTAFLVLHPSFAGSTSRTSASHVLLEPPFQQVDLNPSEVAVVELKLTLSSACLCVPEGLDLSRKGYRKGEWPDRRSGGASYVHRGGDKDELVNAISR